MIGSWRDRLRLLFRGRGVKRIYPAQSNYFIRERYPKNVEGPFYVENGECIACGALEIEADGLMSHDDTSHCFFSRQPISPDEVDSAIRATCASCCGAIRYGGNDPAILTRFAEFGEAERCDKQLSRVIEMKHRHIARFKYSGSPELDGKDDSVTRTIIDYLASSIRGNNSECKDFQYGIEKAAFKFFWALSLKGSQHSILISIVRVGSDEWSLHITENDHAARWTAVHLDKILRQNAGFRSIRWFDLNSADVEKNGRPHPY